MSAVPKVSIIVPALNEEENIQRLLDSFQNQTNSDFEVIIVDNGSTDTTKEIVQKEISRSSCSLRLLIEDQKGVGFARRRGMNDAAARGVSYLAGTDADSVVSQGWVETIINTFESTNADCAFGFASFSLDFFEKNSSVYKLLQDVWTVRVAVAKNTEVPPRGVNFAITNAMYQKVGGMPQPQDENNRSLPGEDIALQQLVKAQSGNIVLLDSTVATSPRRVLRAIIKDSPNDYYKDFEDVRGDKELSEEILALPIEQLEQFVDQTLQRVFSTYIVKNSNTPMWENAKKFVYPHEDIFLNDARTLEPDELYKKYKESFIINAKKIYL